MKAFRVAVALATLGLTLPPGARAEASSLARFTVTATVETAPVLSERDSADDPSLWVHPTDPGSSLVIATDKRAAIEVYDLAGRRLSRHTGAGAVNNVDLRDGFWFGARYGTLVASAGPGLAFSRLDPAQRRLIPASARRIGSAHYEEGVCLYRSLRSGRFYAFHARPDGVVTQFALRGHHGVVEAIRVRAFDVGGAVEGCAADDEKARVYLGEEDRGLWSFPAEPDQPAKGFLVDRTRPGAPSGGLTADIEGIAIVRRPGQSGYLIASSQGDDAFTVYRRSPPHQLLARFRVGPGAVDGCSGTDGIEATAAALGPAFPAGVFICQDHENTGPKRRQDFKLVPLQAVLGRVEGSR